jgi:hypothetical protein
MVGRSEVITYKPSELLTVVRVKLVSTSVTVIFASGISAPEGSVTLPFMVLEAWPQASVESNNPVKHWATTMRDIESPCHWDRDRTTEKLYYVKNSGAR